MDTIKNTEWTQDKYDDSLIKSGSGAESILMGVGYAIPSFFIGKYVPSRKMITSALVTQGNSVEKALSNQKDNSLSKVDESHEKGYILPEVYAHREEIMNYTDEEYYQNIRQSYINGAITEREYNDYEKIRSMNWTTRDNSAMANMVGVTTGIVSRGVAEFSYKFRKVCR